MMKDMLKQRGPNREIQKFNFFNRRHLETHEGMQLRIKYKVIELPIDHYVICVCMEDGDLFMFVELNRESKKIKKKFAVLNFVSEVPSNFKYVGTFSENGFFRHLYEVVKSVPF